jgi:hypothetical protein
MEEEAILREQEKLRRELAILSYVVSSSTIRVHMSYTITDTI